MCLWSLSLTVDTNQKLPQLDCSQKCKSSNSKRIPDHWKVQYLPFWCALCNSYKYTPFLLWIHSVVDDLSAFKILCPIKDLLWIWASLDRYYNCQCELIQSYWRSLWKKYIQDVLRSWSAGSSTSFVTSWDKVNRGKESNPEKLTNTNKGPEFRRYQKINSVELQYGNEEQGRFREIHELD